MGQPPNSDNVIPTKPSNASRFIRVSQAALDDDVEQPSEASKRSLGDGSRVASGVPWTSRGSDVSTTCVALGSSCRGIASTSDSGLGRRRSAAPNVQPGGATRSARKTFKIVKLRSRPRVASRTSRDGYRPFVRRTAIHESRWSANPSAFVAF